MTERSYWSRSGASDPADLPDLPRQGASRGSPSWADHPAPVAPTPFVGQTGFADAVTELQQRVAARLSADGARYAGLDPLGKRLRSEGLVTEELESWVSHRAQIGLPVLTDADEDAVVASVLAALGGYGPLEPLLARDDIEDIFFNGTHPTVLRLAGGDKILGPPLAVTDVALQQMLQMLAGSGLDDSAGREFSTARPAAAAAAAEVRGAAGRADVCRDGHHPAPSRHDPGAPARGDLATSAAPDGHDRRGVGGASDRDRPGWREGHGLRGHRRR